jgi:hypothetical protein
MTRVSGALQAQLILKGMTTQTPAPHVFFPSPTSSFDGSSIVAMHAPRIQTPVSTPT